MQTLTIDEFKGKRNDAVVVNTLPEDHFQKGHIPETKNVPESDPNFEQRVAEIAGGKDKPVIVYCASPECDSSPKAARKLEDAGFDKVYDFEGGVQAWKEAGGEVESSG